MAKDITAALPTDKHALTAISLGDPEVAVKTMRALRAATKKDWSIVAHWQTKQHKGRNFRLITSNDLIYVIKNYHRSGCTELHIWTMPASRTPADSPIAERFGE